MTKIAAVSLALIGASFAHGSPFVPMEVDGAQVLHCEERSILRENGVNLRSIYIPNRWVKIVNLPDRFIVIDEADMSIAVSGKIDDATATDLSAVSDTIRLPAAAAIDPDYPGTMARSTGKDAGLFYLVQDNVAMTWTCRMLKPGRPTQEKRTPEPSQL